MRALKRAGLRVAVILMVGVGGARFADGHVRRTLELAPRLPLEAGDIVYLAPFRESAGSEYARRAREEGVTPLDDAALDDQYVRLRDGIRGALPGVRVTRYEIREFVYLAQLELDEDREVDGTGIALSRVRRLVAPLADRLARAFGEPGTRPRGCRALRCRRPCRRTGSAPAGSRRPRVWTPAPPRDRAARPWIPESARDR